MPENGDDRQGLEHKRLEQESEERRLYLEGLLACVPDAIVTLDSNHRVKEWNQRAEQLFGYSCEEVYGRDIDGLITSPDPAMYEQATGFTQRILAGKPSPPTETVRYRKDGTPVDVLLAGSPILVAGELVGVVGVYTDISQRKRALEETRRRAIHLQVLNEVIAAASAAPDMPQLLQTVLCRILQALGLEMGAIWVADELVIQGIPKDMAVAAGDMTHSADLKTLGVVAIADWRDVPSEGPFGHMKRHLERIGAWASITVPIRAEGQYIGGLSVAAPEPRAWSPEEFALVESIGQQLGSTAERLRLLQQVRRQATELEMAVARLRELDHLKSEFMQNVSHELRTPLSLIWGYAALLASGELGDLSPLQRGPIESIARQTLTLTAMVEDITLLLATETRRQECEPVAVGEIVRSAVEDFQLAASQAGLALSVEVQAGLPRVNGSPVRLRRVVENLLENAIKFTPAGGDVSVRLARQDTQLALQVIDTGIGIAPEKQEHVFERFYQVDGSVRKIHGGAGLGLALVKEIAEACGGSVAVQSTVGQGSTFTVTLPIPQD